MWPAVESVDPEKASVSLFIYGDNISPDPQTGIGAWLLEAFTRAMREGVARDGSHLWPAFE